MISSKADLLFALVVFSAFVSPFQSKQSSLPAGCSARLRVTIWRMRVDTGVDVTLDSCPSPLSVRVLSPELPSEWSRDSSNFYNHTPTHHITELNGPNSLRLDCEDNSGGRSSNTTLKMLLKLKSKQTKCTWSTAECAVDNLGHFFSISMHNYDLYKSYALWTISPSETWCSISMK